MGARKVTGNSRAQPNGLLQARLDELVAQLVSDVIAAARRSLEVRDDADADDADAYHPSRHGVRRLEALQRAIQWQLQLETGRVRSKADIARREGITRGAVSQTLHLLDKLSDHAAPIAIPISPREGSPFKISQNGQLQGYRRVRRQVLRHFEADYLKAALEAASGSISAAARIARVDRKHLWRLLQRTGVRYAR